MIGRPRCGSVALLLLLSIAALVPDRVLAQARDEIRVALPNDHNLQWMNFWVAQGAGYFPDEGITLNIVAGSADNDEGGRGAVQALLDGQAELAVLPRPMFLIAVSQGQPLLAFANLLRNDPINLVVHRQLAEARNLSPASPLSDRLSGLRGLRIGVAPGPVARLRALLAMAGLDADGAVEILIVAGELQNQFFADAQVDALYAHTPYLERALAGQDAVMLVNQSAGEIPALAGRQIHMLVTTRQFRDTHPDVLQAVTRAVLRAQRLIHSDIEAASSAIRRSEVRLQEPDALDLLVRLYAPAIPDTPAVTIDGALKELALFPSRRAPPELGSADLAAAIDNRFAERALTD